MRNAASKVMWVGRATVFMVGLAVMIALVLGVATTALGATGASFILGKPNSAETPTSLVSTLSKATQTALSVTNKSGGPALKLGVLSGKAPIKVNATAGTATNLSADKLDGLDSAEFLGKSEKAADSELLDGKNSSDFAAAYKRTEVVSPTGTDTQNGQALLDALSGITDASATKPYLIYIEPGTYDLGTRSLQMKQHVDMEGAGELKTLITSGVSQCLVGTLRGANNAELRFLTVRNVGTGTCNLAIDNSSTSPRLTHVTAEATGVGGSGNFGVLNSNASPIMTNVTATASGGRDNNYGVQNLGSSSPTIKHSKLSGSIVSLGASSEGTVKVALTQLVGRVAPPPPFDSGTLQCFNNYDQNMAAVTCP